jgi:hypothetical protein
MWNHTKYANEKLWKRTKLKIFKNNVLKPQIIESDLRSQIRDYFSNTKKLNSFAAKLTIKIN